MFISDCLLLVAQVMHSAKDWTTAPQHQNSEDGQVDPLTREECLVSSIKS